jgi:hypothetical protein
VYVGSSLEPWHHSDGEDDNEELSRIYTIESTREEPVEVGYPLYNSGELPPLANPGPSLTCDDIKLGKDLTPDKGKLCGVFYGKMLMPLHSYLAARTMQCGCVRRTTQARESTSGTTLP